MGKLNLSNIDIALLTALYEHEFDQLKIALINGAAGKKLEKQKKKVIDLSNALNSRLLHHKSFQNPPANRR